MAGFTTGKSITVYIYTDHHSVLHRATYNSPRDIKEFYAGQETLQKRYSNSLVSSVYLSLLLDERSESPSKATRHSLAPASTNALRQVRLTTSSQ